MAGCFGLFIRAAVVGKINILGIARAFLPLAGDLCRGMENGPIYGRLLEHSIGDDRAFAAQSMVKVGVGHGG